MSLRGWWKNVFKSLAGFWGGHPEPPREATPERETLDAGTSHERVRETHPAYGMIQACRITGGMGQLHGSAFETGGCVRIRVSTGHVDRSLSNYWHRSDAELVEVDLSEAQWGTFTSSLNVGDGHPCTLRRVLGVDLPRVVGRRHEREVVEEEFRKMTAAVVEKVDAQRALAEKALAHKSVPKAVRESVLATFEAFRRYLTDSLPFVVDQFGEAAERTTQEAMSELAARVTTMAQQFGAGGVAGAFGDWCARQVHGGGFPALPAGGGAEPLALPAGG